MHTLLFFSHGLLVFVFCSVLEADHEVVSSVLLWALGAEDKRLLKVLGWFIITVFVMAAFNFLSRIQEGLFLLEVVPLEVVNSFIITDCAGNLSVDLTVLTHDCGEAMEIMDDRSIISNRTWLVILCVTQLLVLYSLLKLQLDLISNFKVHVVLYYLHLMIFLASILRCHRRSFDLGKHPVVLD